VQREILDPAAHRALRAGQERGADAIGPRAQAQVEARGLDLPLGRRPASVIAPASMKARMELSG
jgi:hypothetical protein